MKRRTGMGWEELVLLALIGLAAGTMNSIVGGGSLLTVPALISIVAFGEKMAVASNRFVLIFMTATGAYHYWRLGKLRPGVLKKLVPGVLPGAFIGALIVEGMDEHLLRLLIGGLSILLLGLLFYKPEIGLEEREPSESIWLLPLCLLISFLLGIYGGLFGAGVSTLFCFFAVFMMGTTMVQGIGTALVLTLIISLVASGRFAYRGYIRYLDVIPLGLGMVTGALIGPKLAVLIGNRWVKLVFSVLVAFSSLKMLFPDQVGYVLELFAIY